MTGSVIIFGATGAVGRAAALAASKNGASKVWLATRDTNKTIPGLDESSGNFTRIQADLTNPESLTSAVQQSGATFAFVYTIMESPDNMKAAFQALKAAGITYAVLLSSISVVGPARNSSTHKHLIPRAHALTEIALEESGIPFTALRPAYFASNVLWNKAEIEQGEVAILFPNTKFDFIAPEDIGRVAGLVLVKGQASEPILLMGPKLYDAYEAYKVIGGVLGKDIKVKEINAEEFHQLRPFIPLPVRESIIDGYKDGYGVNEHHAESAENVRKYGEFEPTQLADWVESHKAEFAL